MLTNVLADIVMILHFVFILFAIVGAILVIRWPRLAWLHVPCVLWAALIELFQGICPLTPLENQLRISAGKQGYEESFIAHYIGELIYPAGLTSEIQMLLGIFVLFINIGLYSLIIKRNTHRQTYFD